MLFIEFSCSFLSVSYIFKIPYDKIILQFKGSRIFLSFKVSLTLKVYDMGKYLHGILNLSKYKFIHYNTIFYFLNLMDHYLYRRYGIAIHNFTGKNGT